MGLQRKYRCKNCGYSVLTAAGRARGFEAITDTFTCNCCHEIVDIVIGYVDPDQEIERFLKNEASSYLKCGSCGSQDIDLWNIENKLCPKCNSPIEIDSKAEFKYWD